MPFCFRGGFFMHRRIDASDRLLIDRRKLAPAIAFVAINRRRVWMGGNLAGAIVVNVDVGNNPVGEKESNRHMVSIFMESLNKACSERKKLIQIWLYLSSRCGGFWTMLVG
ncbi:hypothetical protein [Sphingopyxis witflariensis]|uniref:hypothetical protein n=1 Tax=Sphingopyxis witflariensis TaxID=173675 RepID=UPI001181C00E|nr:hypothetical protein [Sphingopyxis witflariensis]